MFRHAREIKIEAAEKKLEKLREQWQRTAGTWYDGTVAAVEKRIAHIDAVIAVAVDGMSHHGTRLGNYAINLLPELRANRDQLECMRDRMAGFDISLSSDPMDKINQGQPIPRGTDPELDYQRRTQDAQAYANQPGLAGGVENTRAFVTPEEHEQEYGQRTDQARGYAAEQEAIHGPYRDATRQAAIDFIAEENTTDRSELLIRAQRLVEARTSTWTREASRAAVREFVGAVEAHIPRQRRQVGQQHRVASFTDFDDHMMFS